MATAQVKIMMIQVFRRLKEWVALKQRLTPGTKPRAVYTLIRLHFSPDYDVFMKNKIVHLDQRNWLYKTGPITPKFMIVLKTRGTPVTGSYRNQGHFSLSEPFKPILIEAGLFSLTLWSILEFGTSPGRRSDHFTTLFKNAPT